jgi:DNA polymerase-3 subunit alpha
MLYHLIVLAKDQQGWENLLDITTRSWRDGFYYKPRIWLDMMKPRKEGLIVLSGCLNGPISHELMRAVECKREGKGDLAKHYMQRAAAILKRFKDEFGEDFYFEIQMPGPDIADGYDVLNLSIKMAKMFNVKTVLTGDSHYMDKDDFIVQRAMMAIDQDTTIDDPNMFIIDTCEGYMKSRAQFRETFHEQGYKRVCTINDIEEACDNSLEVAEKCQNFTPDLTPKLPEIDNADKELARLTLNGLMRRGYHKSTKKYWIDGRNVTYMEQAKIELKRIKEKKFSSYFLITRDLVMHSRNHGYDVGPARGSAGGSLVCFLIDIHEMNPMEWGLSFDRFLSMSRGGYMLECAMK